MITSFTHRRNMLYRIGLAALLCTILTACDTSDPAQDPLLAPAARMDAMSSALTLNVGDMAGSVLFDGIRHSPLGQTHITIDPTTGDIIFTGTAGTFGFRSLFGQAAGIQRSFVPIDIAGSFRTATWQARVQQGEDESTSRMLRTQFITQDDQVVLFSDVSGLGSEVQFEAYNAGVKVGEAIVPSRGPVTQLRGAALLELASAKWLGGKLTYTFGFAQQLCFVIDGLCTDADEARLVMDVAQQMVFTDETWRFRPGSGSTDVVGTGASLGAFLFRPEIGDEVLLFHGGLGEVSMATTCCPCLTCTAPLMQKPLTISTRNLSPGEMAGFTTESPVTLPENLSYTFNLRRSDTRIRRAGDAFSYAATGTLGPVAPRMDDPPLAGVLLRKSVDGPTEVCATFPDFVNTYQVTARKGEKVLLDETVTAGACAALPVRSLQVLEARTGQIAEARLADLLMSLQMNNGQTFELQVHALDLPPGPLYPGGWELLSTGNFGEIFFDTYEKDGESSRRPDEPR